MSEATDENDLDFAKAVFCERTHIELLTRKKKIEVIVSAQVGTELYPELNPRWQK